VDLTRVMADEMTALPQILVC